MLQIRMSLKFCCLVKSKPFSRQSLLSTILKKKHFETIVGKGLNVGNQIFSPFPSTFFPYQRKFQNLSQIEIVVSKRFQFGKDVSFFILYLGLTLHQTTKLWTGPNSKHLQRKLRTGLHSKRLQTTKEM